MTFFLVSAFLTMLWFAMLKVVCYGLAQIFPEGQPMYEVLSNYLWAPAALMGFASTQWVRPWLP